MKQSIRWYFIVFSLLIIIIPMSILGYVSYSIAKANVFSELETNLKQQNENILHNVKSIYDLTNEKLKSNMHVASNIFYSYGTPSIKDGKLVMTNAAETIVLENNTEIISKITEYLGGTATIFQLKDFQGEKDNTSVGWTEKKAMYRVATDVLNPDKTLALGTIVSKQVYDTVMEGRTYYGRAWVVDGWYQTVYEPIYDPDGAIIGTLNIGMPAKDFLEQFKKYLSQISLGKSGYVYILNEKGDYILSYKNLRDGENIIDAQDSDGRYFIRDMITEAKSLGPGKSTIMYYPWQNIGEDRPRMKLSSFGYFEPWDWVIGSSYYLDDVNSELSKIKYVTLLIGLVVACLTLLFVYLFSRKIYLHFDHMLNVLKAVSDGDLSKRVKFKSNIKEIDEFGKTLNEMTDKFGRIIINVMKTINTTANEAEELSASAQQVNASIEQVSSTMQEISKSAQELSKNAVAAAERSSNTQESSRLGARSTKTVMDSMDKINHSTKDSRDKIAQLNEKSEKIENIISTMSSFYEQTNLLAVNSAIEAARAGEAGRGFAVVAEQIRKLAEQSNNSIVEISSLVSSIKEGINESVQSISENTAEVLEGRKEVEKALSSFERIPVLVEHLNKAIGEVNVISEQNAAGAEEVNSSMEEVTDAIQQVALTAQKLSQGADELRNTIKQFKIRVPR